MQVDRLDVAVIVFFLLVFLAAYFYLTPVRPPSPNPNRFLELNPSDAARSQCQNAAQPDDCAAQAALIALNESQCGYWSNPDGCRYRYQLARLAQNGSTIRSAEAAAGCVQLQSNAYRNSCLDASAHALHDSSLCLSITWGQLRQDCLTRAQGS